MPASAEPPDRNTERLLRKVTRLLGPGFLGESMRETLQQLSKESGREQKTIIHLRLDMRR